MALTPLTPGAIAALPYYLQEWLRQIQDLVGGAVGSIPWAQVSKSGANLTDIPTRNHNNLQNIQGGAANDYYHLTAAQLAAIGTVTSVAQTVPVEFAIAGSPITTSGTLAITKANQNANRVWAGPTTGAAAQPTFRALVADDLPIVLTSGTYTPTLTGVANVGASTAYECQYMRVGTVVSVSGKVDVDPTAAVSTQLGISLPIASNIGAAEDCAGTAACPTIAGQSAAILGDAANNRAQMQWIAVDTTNQPMYFQFQYEVI